MPEEPESPDDTGARVEAGFAAAQHETETARAVAEAVHAAVNGEEGGALGVVGGIGEGVHAASEAVEGVLGAAGVHEPLVGTVLGIVGTAGAIVGGAVEAIEEIESLVSGAEGDESSTRGVEEIAAEHADGHDVTMELRCDADEAGDLRAVSFELEETIGRPYVLRVSAVAEIRWNSAPLFRGEDLLGHDVTFTLRRGAHERHVRGIVHRVEDRGTTSTHQVLALTVVPALAALAMERDSRVFMGMRPEEVVDFVAGGSLATYDREIEIPSSIARNAREYCVQYQETNLDFFHRLLEEEGLTYCFEQSDARERVRVAEAAADFPEVETLTEGPVIVRARESGAALTECLYELRAVDRSTPTSVAVQDFDWTLSPNRPTVVESDREAGDGLGRRRHLYEHARALNLGTFPVGAGRDDGAEQMLYRLELAQRDARVVRGAGGVTGFAAGHTVQISDRRDGGTVDDTFLITKVRHRGQDPRLAPVLGREPGSTPRYENEFEAIPASTPYRADRVTPKPRIAGVQTALVVTENDEVLHSDEHRRVRVRFHWDRFRPEDPGREGEGDPASHCAWVRVAQAWAGPGYGTLFVPRKGMEVVVAFLDGDPDRPLIVGCTYNATATPPYTSERDWTVSAIRSETVDGAETLPGHYNELRFDDQKSHELIRLHAERNLVEIVKNDHTVTVGHDETETVSGDRHRIVEKNEHVEIEKELKVEVRGDHHLLVSQNQRLTTGGERHLCVDKEDHESYLGGREVLVHEHDNLRVAGANRNAHVEGQYNITADEHYKVVQGGETLYMKDCVYIESSAHTQLKAPEVRLDMQDGVARLRANTEILLEVGASSIKIGPSGIQITGPTITIDGGGSTVTLDSSGAAVAGTTTARLSSSAMVTIMSGVVAIN